MSRLYERNQESLLCFECGHIDQDSEINRDLCSACGASRNLRLHTHYYRYAFYAMRYGYQYRKHYQSGSGAKPYLQHLDDVLVFVGMIIVSGIVQGASWDAIKVTLRKFTKKNAPQYDFSSQEIEEMISYVVDYESGFQKLPESTRNEILEEMIGDAAAENPKISNKLMLLMSQPDSPQRRKRAEILYRELVRRHTAKNKSLPPKSKTKSFWSKL